MGPHEWASHLSRMFDEDIRLLDSLIGRYGEFKSSVQKLHMKEELTAGEAAILSELSSSLLGITGWLENFNISLGEWRRDMERDVRL